MNKLFAKVAGLTAGLALVVGAGVALASHAEAKAVRAEEVVSFSHTDIEGMATAAAESTSGTYSVFTITVDGITSSGYNAAESVRVYKNASITIESSGGNMTEVEFTCTANGTAKYGPGSMSGEGYVAGSAKVGTWTGDAASFTLVATGNQTRISDFKITYVASEGGSSTSEQSSTSGSSSSSTPVAPTMYEVSFNANGGTGEMSPVLVEEGHTYVLPENGFTAPEGQEFAGWTIEGKGFFHVGDEVTIDAATEVVADWMPIPPEIVRQDLPAGTYVLDLDYSVVAVNDVVAASQTFELKDPEKGDKEDIYYKNVTVDFEDVTTSPSYSEYNLLKNKSITVHNNTNATIEKVEIDWWKYENSHVYVDGSAEAVASTAGTNSEHKDSLMRVYAINGKEFVITNDSTYASNSIFGMQITFKVAAEGEPSVAFEGAPTSVLKGSNGAFKLAEENVVNPTYTWVSSNPEVLSVDAEGNYEALAYGTVKVTVTVACDAGEVVAETTLDVVPDHILTVVEALEIANTLDGSKNETTTYKVYVDGYITNLDADGKTRAFMLSDKMIGEEDASEIMAFGIYSDNELRNYAILNGYVAFQCSIQMYGTTPEIKNLTLIGYDDFAIEFAAYAYMQLDEACETGVSAVTAELWKNLKDTYDAYLDEYAKAKLQAKDLSKYGNKIQKWVARYEIIVANSEHEDFMSRNVAVAERPGATTHVEASSGIAIVTVVAVITITSLAVLIIIKKRKSIAAK